MYYQGAQSGGAAKALCLFVGLLLAGAVVAGIFLGGSELLSPSVHTAKADKLEAEAAALRAQTAYEEQQREIALELAEKKAAIELQALEARRARQLELMEPIVIVGMAIGSIAVLTLTVSVAYYIVVKATAARKNPDSTRRQPAHHKTISLASKRKQQAASESSRGPSVTDRAKVRPDDVTYDGFLAYFCDYILHPNRTRVFYPTGLAPRIEDIYLSILTEAQIITWETNGHSGWILPPQISGVEDVEYHISRRAFYSLASSCQTLSMVEPLLLRNMGLDQEPSPTLWSS